MLTNQLNRIKRAEKFLWNEEIDRVIELKKAFTKGGIQAFPDFGVEDPFILTTDWSMVFCYQPVGTKTRFNTSKVLPSLVSSGWIATPDEFSHSYS